MDNKYIQSLKADSNISDIDEFFSLVHEMWNMIYNDECEFIEENPLQDTPEKLRMPRVAFELARREHTKEMPQGKKPKIYKSYTDPNNEEYSIQEVSEFFDCSVRFCIYGNSKKQAKEWAKKFELFMLTYAGIFKQRGTQEIMFLEESEQKVSTEGRQELPHRTLRYLVRIQRIQIIRSIKLKDIETTVKTNSGNNSDKYPSNLRPNEFMKNYNTHIK